MRHLSLIALFAGLAAAQTPSTPPAFEVASIKPAPPGARNVNLNIGGDRFRTENVPLKMLITFAYDLRDHQLSGGPGWIDDARFDIVAKPDRPVPPGLEGAPVMRQMVQALLAERFHLVTHKERKEMPIYALVVAKGGPKMKVSDPASRGPRFSMGRGQLDATKAKMSMFVNILANQLGRSVLDKTELTGDYDFKLEFTPEMGREGPMKEFPPGVEPPASPDGPSLFTALAEQLGLKLEAAKGPVEVLVIDSVEKPTEN
ncbi:MAG: TIGR03435 family protein [Acidobacteriota bacterium]|nr:TIGR03435 family protein [Acidobacteriota bacterium]